MKQIKLLDGSGHTVVAEWVETDTNQVELAQTQFEEMIRQGYNAAAKHGLQDAEIITSFDPTADVIYLFPPMSGG